MEKITFTELLNAFSKHNEENDITTQWEDKNPLKGGIVFKQGKWFKQDYTEQERTYEFRSDEKYFIPQMGGNSLYANCLDGVDRGVRLDWYLGEWEIDYCYIR